MLIKIFLRGITPPFIYYIAHKIKKRFFPVPINNESTVEIPLLEPAPDTKFSRPFVHDEIYKFIENNREVLEKEKFAVFPDNDNARQLVFALKEQRLFEKDRFKCLNIKNEWKGKNEINRGDFGDKADYENAIIIYTDEYHYILEQFMLWNQRYDTSRIMILRSDVMHGEKARQKVLTYQFQTILDIGCGYGKQSRFFADAGYSVTGITYPEAEEGRYTGDIIKNDKRVRLIIGDYTSYELNEKFDLVWACHVMEHIENIPSFIKKIKNNVNSGGIIAITVPDDEQNATLLHLHKFNAGFILRNLVYAGINCKTAKILTYNYNLSIVIPNVTFFKCRQLKEIFDYLPPEIEKTELGDGNIIFNGSISELNWK